MIDTLKAKKEIVMTLTNNSTSNNSVVDIFSFGSLSTSQGSSSSPLQYVGIDNVDFGGSSNWLFRYYPFGSSVLTTITVLDPTDIDDLISKLNAVFGDIFWYEADSGTHDFNLKVASSLYDLVSYRPTALSPFIPFTTTSQIFISGSSVRVDIGYSNISYNTICTALTTQPYFITTIYVSSSSQNQTTQQFISTITDPDGVSRQKPIVPITDPNQSQNVQMAIPIYMNTSSINTLRYTVLSGQSVHVIVRYIGVSLDEGLELINDGTFKREMSLVKAKDEEEYKRIMEVVKGYDVIGNMEHPKSWTQPPVFAPVPEPKPIFAVPLIYAVAKENGNFFIQML